MNSVEPRPLPNAADMAALKVLAAHVILACPSLHDTAHEVAAELLVKHGLEHLDPDQVYFHRFKAAQSSSTSFTGWQHSLEKPYESLTLTQLVIHRFRATDQDNADLLDLYAGFYTAGPEAENFNETNEVHLHGNEVLKAFWDLNFSDIYRNKLRTFWNDYAGDFRTLAKCNFLSHAVEARDSGQLSDDDFQTAIKAVIGPLTWPVRLNMLQTETAPGEGLHVAALDVAGHVATNLLRIVDAKGRQIVYVPGETQAFEVFETPSELHWWVLNQMNKEAPRRAFLNHFSLADRQAISEDITDLLNRLVSTWGHADHHLINQTDQTITADAFSWLRDSTRQAMFAEADLSLTSNGDLRKKLWIGYLSAGLKLFGPMAAVGWPVALPVIGASLASMGLNIDQAVNGKTASERKDGVIGAVLSAIDVLFNLPFLKGVGSEAEVGAEVDAAEAAEWDEYRSALDESAPPEQQTPVNEQTEGALPPAEEISALPAEAAKPSDIPQAFETNELLDGKTPISESGKFQGIYALDSDPPYAILMNDTAYYVRYFPDSQGGGYWAIIDPARPNQFIHSLPVRLNAEGVWERMPKLRLPAGGQCLGKTCEVELEMTELPDATQPVADTPETPQPSTSRTARLVKTPYDVAPHARASLRQWALGIRETHVQVQMGPGGALVIPDRYAVNFADKAATLLSSARRFYQNLPWENLPPRPPIPTVDSTTTFRELFERALSEAPGLVIGETLDRITSMRLVIEDMPTLASQGVKTLYMRRLLADFAQTELNNYFNTGVMSNDLEAYLTRLGTDPAGQFNELELVKTARAHGVRVQAIDCAANYRKPIAQTAVDEQMIASHLAHEIMFSDKLLNDSGKWVVLTGVENTNTFRGLAGLSELEGGIGLRIEEVYPGQGQRIDLDPGTEIERGPFFHSPVSRGNVDPFHADLRLQMEAPAVSWTEGQTRRLLFRQGMFLFEKTEGAYTLVHRSSNGSVVRTAVEAMADGNYRIIRPSWPTISGVTFASVEALSKALKSIGLSLQSRVPA
ncbi:membrane-targeted effector domain-containing toxin [Pseudomonas sp. 14P_8.1_Bac3]|uniref:membrane-targeted effector domain-containing toxin n=1 Tax=Pseudomonas sp. 14P_8.1_Bac3 TaxID=2971621 RepID=UPI0021C57921|nr:membrane-targeted effector domain-containing toxin [Pseudomonas sp. 14P_8.1_Bac3]MCU1761240.1 membrane-targeted effector domain-containing toxin [Pseudomonas sp. 14P_8.1_Bac3]